MAEGIAAFRNSSNVKTRENALRVFGLSEEQATPKTIREKYLELARVYHTDKGGDKVKFQIVDKANKLLTTDNDERSLLKNKNQLLEEQLGELQGKADEIENPMGKKHWAEWLTYYEGALRWYINKDEGTKSEHFYMEFQQFNDLSDIILRSIKTLYSYDCSPALKEKIYSDYLLANWNQKKNTSDEDIIREIEAGNAEAAREAEAKAAAAAAEARKAKEKEEYTANVAKTRNMLVRLSEGAEERAAAKAAQNKIFQEGLDKIRARQEEGRQKEKAYWDEIRAREAAAKANPPPPALSAEETQALSFYESTKTRLLGDCNSFAELIGRGDIKIDVPDFWEMIKDRVGEKKDYYLVHYIIILLDGVAEKVDYYNRIKEKEVMVREDRFVIDIMPQILGIKNGLNISIKVSEKKNIKLIEECLDNSYWHDERDSDKYKDKAGNPYKVGDGNFYIDYPIDVFFNIPREIYNLSNEEETYDSICSKNSIHMKLAYILRQLIIDFFIRIIDHAKTYLAANNNPVRISRSGDSVNLTYSESKGTVETIIYKNINKLFNYICAIMKEPKIRRNLLSSSKERPNQIQPVMPERLISSPEFKQYILSKIRKHLGLPPEPIEVTAAVQGPELMGKAAAPPPSQIREEVRVLKDARNPWQPDPYRNRLIENLAAAEANVKASWLPNRTRLEAAQNALSVYNALSSAEKAAIAATAAAGKGGFRKSRTKKIRKQYRDKAVSGKAVSGKAVSGKAVSGGKTIRRNKRTTRKN